MLIQPPIGEEHSGLHVSSAQETEVKPTAMEQANCVTTIDCGQLWSGARIPLSPAEQVHVIGPGYLFFEGQRDRTEEL